MDRSYSVVPREVVSTRPKKRARRNVISTPVETSYTYFCVDCHKPVQIHQVILCTCGSRVVRKGKTKKDQMYVAR